MSKQASQPAPKGFQLSSLLSVNLLLVFLPIALIGRISQWSDIVVFLTSALAIVPLAGLIGHATESLATKLGPTIGGLINVTLGNAAELIITIFALRAGLLDLVKASIVGSIIGNLLLVLGFSFLIGGLKNGIQQFNRRTASMNATMVIFAFLALAVPSAFDQALVNGAGGVNRELFFSEGIALVLIALYVVSIVYSLRTPKAPLSEMEKGLEQVAHETHADAMSTGAALGLLAFATIGIVLMSESLVGTVETVGRNLGLSEFFIGIIIVPLIGNVAEHLVAIQVALKNRMDLSVNISLGSSLQVALFVAPVLVFISLFFEKKLLLVFTSYELAALASASVVAALVSQDGESNWVEGVQLLAVYIIFGLAFYLLPAVAGAVH